MKEKILARWGPNHPLAMDPPAGDQAGPAREHDWATLARELRFWLNRREDQLEEGLVDLGQQLLGRLVARARAARLRALEMEPVPVKAPPAIAKKAAAPKAPPPLLPQSTAARSPSPGARVWYGGSANKLAPNAMQQAARAALDRKVRYAVAWTDFTPDEEELLTRDQLRYLMNRFQAAALGAIPDASAREEAQEVETRAMEARAEAEEERARQEAALHASALEEEEALEARARRREEAAARYEHEELELEARLAASREAQQREEEELRAALEASRKAAMDDEPVVEGANSAASTGAFPPLQQAKQPATLRERSPHTARWADLMEGDASGLQPQRPLL